MRSPRSEVELLMFRVFVVCAVVAILSCVILEPLLAAVGLGYRVPLCVGMQGEDVEDMQGHLAKHGYYNGPIDGVFGVKTEEAVKQFQANYLLDTDGVVGKETLSIMTALWVWEKFPYVVKQGDTLSALALRTRSTVKALVILNSLENADMIFVGQDVLLPFGIYVSYTVKDGESLEDIANMWGAPISHILDFNDVSDYECLKPGTVIIIPGY